MNRILFFLLFLSLSSVAVSGEALDGRSDLAISIKMLTINLSDNATSGIALIKRVGDKALTVNVSYGDSKSEDKRDGYNLSEDARTTALSVGARNYYRAGENSLFFEGVVGINKRTVSYDYTWITQAPFSNDYTDVHKIYIAGLLIGGEHFFSEKFSVEGKVGVFTSKSSRSGKSEYSRSSAGTMDGGVNINYYF